MKRAWSVSAIYQGLAAAAALLVLAMVGWSDWRAGAGGLVGVGLAASVVVRGRDEKDGKGGPLVIDIARGEDPMNPSAAAAVLQVDQVTGDEGMVAGDEDMAAAVAEMNDRVAAGEDKGGGVTADGALGDPVSQAAVRSLAFALRELGRGGDTAAQEEVQEVARLSALLRFAVLSAEDRATRLAPIADVVRCLNGAAVPLDAVHRELFWAAACGDLELRPVEMGELPEPDAKLCPPGPRGTLIGFCRRRGASVLGYCRNTDEAERAPDSLVSDGLIPMGAETRPPQGQSHLTELDEAQALVWEARLRSDAAKFARDEFQTAARTCKAYLDNLNDAKSDASEILPKLAGVVERLISKAAQLERHRNGTLAEFRAVMDRGGMPCAHTIGDLTGGVGGITRCGACVDERRARGGVVGEIEGHRDGTWSASAADLAVQGPCPKCTRSRRGLVCQNPDCTLAGIFPVGVAPEDCEWSAVTGWIPRRIGGAS